MVEGGRFALCCFHAKSAQDHPECGYTLVNSPHLRPAFVLDRALVYFAKRVEQNEFAPSGLPSTIETEEHLSALRHALNHVLLPPLQLHEYFVVDVEKHCKAFQERLQNPVSPTKCAPCKKGEYFCKSLSYLNAKVCRLIFDFTDDCKNECGELRCCSIACLEANLLCQLRNK